MPDSTTACLPPEQPDRGPVDPAEILAKLFRTSREAALLQAVRITRNPDVSEDIVQAAFARIWERRRHWRHPDGLRKLLLVTVKNLALNHRRDAGSQARTLRTAGVELRRAETPPEALQLNELQTALVRLIRDLPPRRRRVFLLRVCHGLSTAEVARLLGLRPQTIANHVAAARKRLIRSLREEGLV